MGDLLPCPFCGGTNLTACAAWVECECSAYGPGFGDVDGRAAWNARADSRFVSEAKTVLNDIADAIGDAGRLGESHGDTIRRLRAELGALRAPELPDGWSLDDQGVAVNKGESVFIDKGGCVQIYGWASRAPIDVVLAVIVRFRARFGGGT